MLISSSLPRYLPVSLPLQGPDYQVAVHKRQPAESRLISKVGPQIRVESDNPADCLTLESGPAGLSYAPDGHLPTKIYKRGDQVAVRRPGGDDVVFSQFGNQIMVDRPGWSRDVYFLKTPDGLRIDRAGFANDVEISRSGQTYSFRHGQSLKDTVVSLPIETEFDPVAFQDETTVSPQGLALLGKWFEEGIQPTDLITLTQKGELLEWDHILH